MLLRMSTLFLRTLRDDPADAEVPSHRLLARGGYIRRAAPGGFTWLPLGFRVFRNVERIVREEMDAMGAQEVHFPALLPREPYEATNRWTEYGPNLFRLKDRRGNDFLLGPTHEEMFTLLVKDLYGSYKDLPVSLYQIRTTLRNGLAVGLAFAAGIALVDLAYAALGAAGVAPLLTIGPLETILGLLGAAVLVFLGARTLRSAFRVRLGDAAPAMSPARAFGVAVSMTAANPLTIASWAAIFSAASAAGAASSLSSAVLLVAGVGLGSATWDVTLAIATALVGRYVGKRFLQVVDLVAGIALLFFGAVLAYSVVV